MLNINPRIANLQSGFLEKHIINIFHEHIRKDINRECNGYFQTATTSRFQYFSPRNLLDFDENGCK